jgi:uncharacterized membrane protein (DUF373 family)
VLLFAERAVYYVAALGLIAAAGAMFVVMTIDVLRGLTGGLTQTIVTVLGRMLLAFILLELAHSIRIVLQEQTLVAEPFLLIGLIAVVRRILILTAQAERLPLKGESVNDLVLELAVLTALVIALAAALYMLYPPGRRADPLLESGDAPSGG